jgi:UDP-N-acetyl-D-mannosaminuronate dehydrogenase
MNINVMGLGKLGFPMASFLSAKHNVQCFDLNHKLIDLLRFALWIILYINVIRLIQTIISGGIDMYELFFK